MEKVLKVHAINEMWFQSKIREPKKNEFHLNSLFVSKYVGENVNFKNRNV